MYAKQGVEGVEGMEDVKDTLKMCHLWGWKLLQATLKQFLDKSSRGWKAESSLTCKLFLKTSLSQDIKSFLVLEPITSNFQELISSMLPNTNNV